METKYKFHLFVSETDNLSKMTISFLKEYCERHLENDCELIITNIDREPEQASLYNIFALPTLIQLSPPPERRFFGRLRDIEHINQLVKEH